MAHPRASKKIIDAAVTVNAGIVSNIVRAGSATNVIFLLRNDGANSAKVKVQVAGTADAPGLNAAPTNDNADDNWYDLMKADGSGIVTITVAAGANIAFDVSPFAGNYARLWVEPTTPGSQTTVTAYVEITG